MLIPFGVFSAAGSSVSNSYELISTTILPNSSSTSVTFDVSSLASTYKHLQVRVCGFGLIQMLAITLLGIA
jgi:hypothetical protein